MGSIQEVTFEDASKNTFFILCTPGKVESWREDKSVNLMSVLQVYDIYTRRRTRGEPARPSKGELESAFGTSDKDEVIRLILEQGEIKKTNANISEDRLSTILPQNPSVTTSGYEGPSKPQIR